MDHLGNSLGYTPLMWISLFSTLVPDSNSFMSHHPGTGLVWPSLRSSLLPHHCNSIELWRICGKVVGVRADEITQSNGMLSCVARGDSRQSPNVGFIALGVRKGPQKQEGYG